MSEISFEVKQEALALVKNTVIEANFAECEAALTEMMTPYKTMVVTEDGIAAAKTDRANIRKVAGRIDEMRKVVKKAYTEPLKAFEDKCKALVSICDEGSANLDIQIKEFEERERAEKIEILHQFYLENTDEDERSFCPWEFISKKEWGNKTYSIEAAEEDILDAVCKMRSDLNVVREYGEGDTPYLLDVYKQTHELSAVIRKASELKTMRDREEARKREEAEIAARAAERFEQTIKAAQAPVIEAEEEDEPLVTVSFKVTCTKAQLSALGEYMKRSGIKYGRA